MKKVLFVCIENSCRSQMAEAYAHLLGENKIEAFSSGSRPSGRINPRAIQFMAEVGYDLNKHHSKSLDEIPQIEYDAAITMGCGDECPSVKAKRRQDWNLGDPKNENDEKFRMIRDEIKEKVKSLVAELGK